MKIDVGHVAKLANLTLTPGEKEKFEKQLSSILEYVEKLNWVDTSEAASVAQITGLKNVTREDDETQISLTQEEALTNSPDAHNGLFKVKAILESDK